VVDATDENGGCAWSAAGMGHVQRFDHVGITVNDLETVVTFFEALGLEASGRQFVEGEFIDTVCAIPGSRTEIVGFNMPGGGTWLEVARFITPDHVPGLTDPPANQLGIRNVCFVVDDIEAAVATVAELGYGLVGGIGEHEGTWKMAYVRGPEGIVVSLTQQVG
jgi:catechol 2,3-dioxygenase-like lactoylglutathione lyase family enzyme